MLRIFDCSNSEARPEHRGGGGPVENDVMRYLKENASAYNAWFAPEMAKADLIITNDVFTQVALDSGKPLVKRMCAPFWQSKFQERNAALNKAAEQADKVIFITKYSKNQYFYCKSPDAKLKSNCIVRHWVDPDVFFDFNMPLLNDGFVIAASATDWSREEKRLGALIDLANRVDKENGIKFNIIGKVNKKLPINCIRFGYIKSPKDMACILNQSNFFINLSYRDAATKTVCQAISCGLPVLFADSGGVHEMVNQYGLGIPDDHALGLEGNVPELDTDQMAESMFDFIESYDVYKTKLRSFDSDLAFKNMLDGYFAAIESVTR